MITRKDSFLLWFVLPLHAVAVLIIMHKWASDVLNGCHPHQICKLCIAERFELYIFNITGAHQNLSQCVIASQISKKYGQKLHIWQKTAVDVLVA